MNVAQPKRTSFAKLTHSYVRRSFQRKSAVRTQFRVPRVPTVTKNFPTGNSKFSTVDLGNKGNAVKASACWIWRPKQNSTDKECIVLGRDFKLKDDTNVLLRTPRQHNMYSIDLNNIVPHKYLTCLVAKASTDEKIENLKDLKVKIIRCDNGGEFRNKEMNDFCSKKGIKREFSNARTPQQNGVAKRRNMSLIEAARTMVLVNKSQNKTPYELFNGKTHAIGFLKPFGCHVMIPNTLDHLGKFDAKGDEGTSSTNLSGTKDAASQDVKKDVSSLKYIAFPNWFHEAHLESSTSNAQDTCNTDALESSGNYNPTATSTNPLADQLETLTVESAIHTVSLPVLTACLKTSPEITSGSRLILKRVTSQDETPSLDNISALSNRFEDILGVTTNTSDTNEVEADLGNMEYNISASPTPTFRIYKDHPKSQIIGHVDTPNVWILVDCPKRVRPIGTKWVLKNKKDERGIMIRNKARLVAQGHTQEEGIDYEEVFAPVARIKAIRLFLAYASFMGFTVYQMDVKSAFLYGTIDEEVYVMQPSGFQDLEFPDRVYKVEKAMYGLHQAPRAWYGTLSKYLLTNGFQRGTIDQTLFIRRHRGNFTLVQVYVDDIIFGSSNPQLCREFEALIHDKF
nr:putative ribonuclease H-like domain-containing protein [Tanacetum cinerariifolium]